MLPSLEYYMCLDFGSIWGKNDLKHFLQSTNVNENNAQSFPKFYTVKVQIINSLFLCCHSDSQY